MAYVSFRNPRTLSRGSDLDLPTERVVHLASLGVFTAGGLERGGKSVVAVYCVLF